MGQEHNSAIASGAAFGPQGGAGAHGEVKSSVGVGAIQTGGSLTKSMSGNISEVSVLGSLGKVDNKGSAGIGGNFVKAGAVVASIFMARGEKGPTMGDNASHSAVANAGAGFAHGASGGHDVSMASLGNMHPSPTPGMGGRSQDVGMGM